MSLRQKESALKRPATASSPELQAKVRAIVAETRKRKDAALKAFTRAFDGVKLATLEVSTIEKRRALERFSPDSRRAMERAVAQIERFHLTQIPRPVDLHVSPGLRLQRQARAIERVGLYVPGGSAPLPSTVLMLGVPARIAGCELRVLCTPPGKDGLVNDAILVAAEICGIDRVFKVGGAQAIAAMAYGTKSIPKVDKIFGPGNRWVTEAKLQVAIDAEGAVCDMPAGPSEVLVIADKHANAEFVAADLLSQAEHGEDSQVILVCDDERQIKTVLRRVTAQLSTLSRRKIAEKSLAKSLAIQVDSLEEAIGVSNAYAPEHLILQVESPGAWVSRIRNAGSVFLGAWSPESLGDYASGTNHVLPTYGYARVMGGISVESFLKQITFQEATPMGLKDVGPVVERLARMEGLQAHERAVSLRLASLAEAGL